ncbi:MAG: ATPase [Clostridia bacterium]|nr:ATPase [Clostridia bacterium]
MEHTHYYLGIDGGGTKSRCLLDFEDGRQVVLQGGPMNICSVSQEQVARNLETLFRQVEQITGGLSLCLGVGIGAAGFTNVQARPFFAEQAARWFPGIPAALDTDGAVALYGAHESREGMVLIAGTGSVCFGIRGKQDLLTGGGGHIIDDEGSGYAIGRDILTAVLKSLDGRSPDTALAEALRKSYGIATRAELISFVYHPDTGKQDIAALAPLLTAACDAGDPAALDIARKAAWHLAEMVDAVARTLDMPRGPLAFSGSILTKQVHIRKIICKILDRNWPDMLYYTEKKDAAAGAALMARWAAQAQLSQSSF